MKIISVIGAGLMGHGIAQEFAQHGFEVRLHDLTPELLEKAQARIRQNLEMLAGFGRFAPDQMDLTTARIRATVDLAEAVAEADLVIEAVSENLDVKHRVFAELDRLAPPRAILASNTSTFMPGKLAAATRRPDRVLITHYFNPPYLVPLVEVVGGPETSAGTVETVLALLKRMGKNPVRLAKEAPGFVANRLQMALFREALSIVAQGIAGPQEVDEVMRSSIGRRWAAAGVFEVWEVAGWDVIQAISEQLLPEIESSREVSPLLRAMVARGDLGVKTGKGFYEWDAETERQLRQRMMQALIRIAEWERGA